VRTSSVVECFDRYVVSCRACVLNPIGDMIVLPQRRVNAPAVAYPPSGATSIHIGQMSPTPNPDSILSAGLKTYSLAYCAGVMDRTSSCENHQLLRSRVQRESQYVSSFNHNRLPFTQRNYHTRKKKSDTSSSRPLKTHTTQQPSAATQGTSSSSQLLPPTAGATGTGTVSYYRTRFWMALSFYPLDLLHTCLKQTVSIREAMFWLLCFIDFCC
jgi:hypothetical protein